MALTEAQKRANYKYKQEKTEQINFRVPKGAKEIIQQLSMQSGEPMQRYIIRACYMRARADAQVSTHAGVADSGNICADARADSGIYKGLPWCDDL